MNLQHTLYALPLLAFVVSFSLLHLMLKTGVGLFADVPNARSLHAGPVPRGGGIGFVASVLLTWSIAHIGAFQQHAWVWYICPFAAMAFVGWLDDRGHVGIVTRLVVQFCSAGLALYLMPTPNPDWPLSPLMVIIAGVMIVWVTNLFNFMDGMDGLAGSQAVVVYAVMGLWFASRGAVELTAFCLIASAATVAFLLVNWHPARVFMGDSGSLALGIGIAVLSLAGVVRYGLPLAAFLILMGVFLFDATFTLLRRVFNRERWWQSHRSHVYQRAHALGISQRRIVSVVIGMDMVLAALGSMLVFGDIPHWVPIAGAMAVVVVPAAAIHRLETRAGAGASAR